MDSTTITSLNCINWWKSKDYRLFLLHVSFPLILIFGPPELSSHFLLYFVAIRVMHFYENIQDVVAIEPLLDEYRKVISTVYNDDKLQLYSLHAHKYLPKQVLSHGALFAHGCFGDESFLGTLKRSRRGNIRVPYQIFKSYLLRDSQYNEEQSTMTIDKLFIDEKIYDDSYLSIKVRQDYFVEFKKLYLHLFNETINTDFPLFCRFVRGTLKFNSLLYSRIGSRLSNIVSFKHNRCPVSKSKCFGILIWYFSYRSKNYAFIKRLTCTNAVLRTQRNDRFATVAHDFIDRFYNLINLNVFDFHIIPVDEILHQTNDEDMIAPLDKCNITNDDTVEYRCGQHVYEGSLTTLGPKTFCDKLLKKMNGHSTDYLYSSLPDDDEQDEEEDEDDRYLHGAKSTQDTVAGPAGSSSIIQIKSPTTAVSTNDSNVVQNIEPTTLSSARNYSSELTSIQTIEPTDFAHMASNEVSIEILHATSTMSPTPTRTNIHEPETCEKSYRNVHTPVAKKRSIPLLSSSSSSSNKLSPCIRFISLLIFFNDVFVSIAADRLSNIECAMNSLISYVNELAEQVSSLSGQLKPMSKTLKVIHNHVVPHTVTDVIATPSSLRTPTSSFMTPEAKKVLMFNDQNLMNLKHELTSIRSFLRKMTMKMYSRGEILAEQHLDDKDDRYMTIIQGLKSGFNLNDDGIEALHASLKETRRQLARDVRYLKVMKPTSVERALTKNIDQNQNESTTEQKENDSTDGNDT
ncbi:unnamed protein product [Rotaria sp. Silwood2]|nr:unnamed protein product [Rotaria sp. Silwood2]